MMTIQKIRRSSRTDVERWRRLEFLPFCLVLSMCICKTAWTQEPISESPPNFLVIVADDLGYTDIGAYGSEIRTPNLDALAGQSIKFTNFHALPTCAPTRAVLLSGTDNHTAGLGSMFGPNFLPAVEGQVGYERYLLERVAALPELLTDADYHSYMAGKWHLGSREGQWPTDRGFERSFALLGGAGAHFAIAENQYVENGARVDARSENFYSTEAYTDKLISNIAEQHGDGRPFFAYAAYTSPHWPLQVPDDYLDRYAGVYDEGYDVLRAKRVARAEELGVVPESVSDDTFERVGPAWDDLDEDTKKHYAKRMEIYAAMVENLDDHVGRLITYLEGIGELDTTVIFFMSDNGAESDERDLFGNTATRVARGDVDNTIENLGRRSSYISYGAGWAQAGTAPFNRFKGFVNDGGTRVPAFILNAAGTNPVRLDNQYLGVVDIAPTILELAGLASPGPVFRGRNVMPMEGRSFARVLAGNIQPIYEADHAFSIELHGGRSVQRGQYKLVWEQPPGNTWWGYSIPDTWYRWRLFNLAVDPGEAHDISASHPDLVTELIDIWDEYAETHGVVRDIRIKDFERWTTTSIQ
jgi:arylsulfatase A-like enzyme